jgi:hypothetical protein
MRFETSRDLLVAAAGLGGVCSFRSRLEGFSLPAVDGCLYLPREVFFGRLGFAGAFFAVWARDFGRFLPATSDSFPVDVLPGTLLR